MEGGHIAGEGGGLEERAALRGMCFVLQVREQGGGEGGRNYTARDLST